MSKDNKNPVIVRFPPSPTGPFHIGGVRTALYNWLFARQNGGKFLLRIEDTDRERSKKEYEDNIFDSLKWLGLECDASPNGSVERGEVLRQGERTEIYKSKIQELIKKGAAYISEEAEGVNREVVRFRNPGGKIKFTDLIRGEVEMEVGDLSDFIIAKNIDEPLYHLAVVVDDADSGVTHVIRGEDHISNTPRQILILEALGATRPIYAHLPLVLAPDKSKLSKRKHGESVSLDFYRKQGYSREAIINFMALLGWNPGETEQELFSIEELIQKFDLSKVQKKGAIFDIKKLDWMNREYILRQNSEEQFRIFNLEFSKTKWKDHEKAKSKTFMEKLMKIMLDRIHRWGEVRELLETGEFDYFFEKPNVDNKMLLWKNQSPKKAKESLEKVLKILESREKIMELAEKEGRGEVLWPLRVALSGKEKSPDPFTIIDVLGIEEVRNRIRKVIENI